MRRESEEQTHERHAPGTRERVRRFASPMRDRYGRGGRN